MKKQFLLVLGEFSQCSWATLNFYDDPDYVYCAKYRKVMYGWTVSEYCHGYGKCDEW